MNPDLLLSWLQSRSSIKRVRAARGFRKDLPSGYEEEIRKAFHKEEVPWVKDALSEVLKQYKKRSKVQAVPKKRLGKEEIADVRIENVEAIQSDAVSDSIGQVLHEIEPAIGALKLVARGEVPNYNESQLKQEFDRLDELLQTFENWRRVEQAPRYSAVNIHDFLTDQVPHEKTDGVGVSINIAKDLEFTLDRALLRIIISNALRNAIESTLIVEEGVRRPIVIAAGLSEKGLWVSVVDRGMGLPANRQLMLASRHSTKPGHRGMGLAVVDKAINALNGTWDLREGRPVGAEFFFEIPRKGD